MGAGISGRKVGGGDSAVLGVCLGKEEELTRKNIITMLLIKKMHRDLFWFDGERTSP